MLLKTLWTVFLVGLVLWWFLFRCLYSIGVYVSGVNYLGEQSVFFCVLKRVCTYCPVMGAFIYADRCCGVNEK